jgi:starch phosphorylase
MKAKRTGRVTTGNNRPLVEDDRTGISVEAIKRAFHDHLCYTLGHYPAAATPNDRCMALAYTVRDRLLHRWMKTIESYLREDVKVVSYLSAEFLMGPQLGNNLINLGIYHQVEQAMKELGHDLQEMIQQEEEPGLGNGGLGRLAACYLDSLATLRIPAIGYGIRYEFGIFDQQIRDGWQVEVTDKWLHLGNPWEIRRPEITFQVNFGGHTETFYGDAGRYNVRWVPDRVVRGVAYDSPVAGYAVTQANMLRLFTAEACESFDFQAFNQGDYYSAIDEKVASENLTKVLYPNDEPIQGKRLRLEQQYFFVSCSLQDMIRMHLLLWKNLDNFHEQVAIQLNDTHPSIAVAELMRLLIDEHAMEWDKAWHITTNSLAYTNHTLLPEALEKWPLELFGSLLPRHLEIIYEINRRHLETIAALHPGDNEICARMSLIDETGERYVRMAHLASVGSHAINGVAALHTELLKKDVLRDFSRVFPERFHNVTNGITPRRWMVLSNPKLAALISSRLGGRWISHLEEEIKRLEDFADDREFQKDWQHVKQDNKLQLARLIRERTGIAVDSESLFDVQVKRIHEYKRQHLNLLHLITLYNRIKEHPGIEITPRTVIFGGKAAPGYFMAKLIIKLINSVAEVVNNDPDVAGRIKVVFIPDFNVKNGQWIYPAADLSEQISTAGKEASGTGNMKFALNGALTIGTLDGANVEIREEVGAENFFLFGLTAEEVNHLKARGYTPFDYYSGNESLRKAIDCISSGALSRGDVNLFRPLVDSLLYHDTYLLCADYQSYLDCQERAAAMFRDPTQWTRMSILNVARMGKFSSDRSIREYCSRIWGAQPLTDQFDDADVSAAARAQ